MQRTLSAQQISVAQSLELTLTATAPEDFVVTFPEFTGHLGDFTLETTNTTAKELSGSTVRQSRTWTLAPFLPGQYVIPAMRVTARRNDEENTPPLITIPARTIPVTSFLTADEKEPEIADIFPPVSQPRPVRELLIAGGAILVLLALICYAIQARRRKKASATPPPAPHLAALEKIDRLLQNNKEIRDHAYFFGELSLILRYYIETGFGLKAPEQTTEEFLDALRTTPAFAPTDKELLTTFLSRSDLIKFARVMPAETEVSESIELCRHFIRVTGEKNQEPRAAGPREGNR